MNDHSKSFFEILRNPLKFRMFLFSKLPSAYFAGVRLKEISNNRCAVTVPFKWFSQNPFRSTYFACLAMAAEMSTGALSRAHSYKISPPVSMLVTRVEGDFIKRATGITTFICEDGEIIRQSIIDATISGQGHVVRTRSIGRNDAGEIVAEFYVTWSFKARKS